MQVVGHYIMSILMICRWRNFKGKGHLFTLNLQMTAIKIHRISLLRTFFLFFWIKSILPHRRCLMSKFPETLMLRCRKIFSVFYPIFHKTFSNRCCFALIEEFSLFLRIWSPHVVLYYRNHFYSILTNLSSFSHSKSSIVPFAKFRSDLKNVLTKHFPTMQPFANVLQNSSSYKFPDIRKIISVLESLFNKVTRLMACNFIKK